MTKQQAKEKIKQLTEKYERLTPAQIKKYGEANTRKDFIIRLFHSLGWDVYNNFISDEVTEEYQASGKRVDYAFKINSITRFFLEAKALSENLYDKRWADQAIWYAWHKSVPWAILCDFEGIMVFNAEWEVSDPDHAKFLNLTYKQYLTDFEKLWWLSKESFEKGILDQEALKLGKKPKTIIDRQLAEDLVRWRKLLSDEIEAYYPKLNKQKRGESVQRILDRLIFIRTTEDRDIEEKDLQSLVRNWLEKKEIKVGLLIKGLDKIFKRFNKDYNSRLFKPHTCDGLTEIDDNIYVAIINELYKTSKGIRYNFHDIPADIFGSIYEQYLGTIQQQEETKAAKGKRKSQGIYYTPRYVVEFIVKSTLGEALKTKSLREVVNIKILDPACGSGSFLISAFGVLDRYLKQEKFQNRAHQITNYARKIQILTSNIFGVDLDEEAVEISQLNLLSKALEFKALLPDLDNNIKHGNSLVSGKSGELKKYYGNNYQDKIPFDWHKEFLAIFKDDNPGFDIVIGNPPWGANIDQDLRYFEKYYPDSSKQHKDIYKIFIDKALQLLKNGGILGFIVPNTFLFQSRFKDIRQLLLKYKILRIVNLGEKVFEGVEAPSCILICQKSTPEKNVIEVLDLSFSKSNDFRINTLKNPTYTRIEQDTYNKTPDNIFVLFAKKESKGVLPLEEILDCKDCGIKYQRIGVGLQQKGKSDLFERIFYEGEIKNQKDHRYLIGKDIDRFQLKIEKERYLKNNYKELLRDNEIVYFNEQYFNIEPKIVWRQTSDKIRAMVIGKMWFANTIQLGVLKEKVKKQLDIYYILALLNSKYINCFYNEMVRESGRVFPQVKLSKVKLLPIKIIPLKEQKTFIELAKKMIKLYKESQDLEIKGHNFPEDVRKIKDEIEDTDEMIDKKVYELYGLTKGEIEIIKK